MKNNKRKLGRRILRKVGEYSNPSINSVCVAGGGLWGEAVRSRCEFESWV
uniref:Uncharacterized protein n=1 Tax=Arion vulgaris TaxID=1028688 RepID=A0A0B7B353_9EUPU